MASIKHAFLLVVLVYALNLKFFAEGEYYKYYERGYAQDTQCHELKGACQGRYDTCCGRRVYKKCSKRKVCCVPKTCKVPGYQYVKEFDSCIKVYDDSQTYVYSLARCIREGNGRLMVLNTEERDAFALGSVTNVTGSFQRFWFGCSWQGGDSTNWRWLDGSYLNETFTNWVPNEPFPGFWIWECCNYVGNGWFAEDCSNSGQRHLSICENKAFNY